MAEAKDLVKDPTDPLTPSLFVREDGSSMSFYARPQPGQSRLDAILQGGMHSVSRSGARPCCWPSPEAAAEARAIYPPRSTFWTAWSEREARAGGLPSARLRVADQAPETKLRGPGPGAPPPRWRSLSRAAGGADGLHGRGRRAILIYVKEHARSSALSPVTPVESDGEELRHPALLAVHEGPLPEAPAGPGAQVPAGEAPWSPSSQKLKRKAEQDPEAADSGEPQNKRTPDLPEEEFEKEEMKENEAAVKKMLVEASLEFEELVVDSRVLILKYT